MIGDDVRRALAGAWRRDVEVRDARRLAGGTSHETWAIDAVDGASVLPLVVRREIGDGVLEGDGDDEMALLGALHRLGLPVPRPWLRVSARDDVPAMSLLERIDGVDVRKAIARGAVGDRRALGRDVIRIQAALHAIDVREDLAGVLPAGVPGAATEVERWASRIAAHRAGPEPLLAAAIGWLRANAPPVGEPCLVHADFKTNNLLLSHDGKVVVVDWELAHVGDPIEDLAWTLLWTTEHDLVGGLLAREEYLATYAELSGRSVDRAALFFWEVLALVKLAAIFLVGVRDGFERRPTLVQLSRAVPVLEARIAERLGAALERGAA